MIKRIYELMFLCFLANTIKGCWDNAQYKQRCGFYRSQGYCTNAYRNFMYQNCRMTCGFCKAPVHCQDNSQNCPYWSSQGYCRPQNSWYTYMFNNCRKTCRFCRTVVHTTRTVTTKRKTTVMSSTDRPTIETTKVFTSQPTLKPANCSNSPQYIARCRQWQHLCRKPTADRQNKWYTFMTKHCKKTCGICGGTKKENKLICGKEKHLLGFVISGSKATRSTWIWQAGLYDYGEFFCGGSLITPRHVLTAAHCVRYKFENGVTVRLGDYARNKNDGTEVEARVEKIVYHENYEGGTLQNDIAILTLKNDVKMSDEVGIVCLPQENEIVPPGTKCSITGWGRMTADGDSANILQVAKMPVVSNVDCGNKNKNKSGKSLISSNMLCAGYEENSKVSGCQGDSGGPFVCKTKENKWVLQGVVSWGSPTCDASQRYTVFARTSQYISWIKKHI